MPLLSSEAIRLVLRQEHNHGIFRGGINRKVAPVKVSADGSVVEGAYPETHRIEGGYTILGLATREAAVEWAAKIAAACRCDQELREFMYDPQS